MENSTQSPVSAFVKGFASNVMSGALMSGIFYGAAFLFQAAGIHILGTITLAHILPIALLMVGAVGVFGGIMSVMRSGREAKEETKLREQYIARDLAPSMTPMLGATVAADRAESPAMQESAPASSWVDRTGGQRMAQQSYAASVLADRDQAATLQNQR